MRHRLAAIVAALISAPVLTAQHADRFIPGGDIFVQGWTGKIDGSSVRNVEAVISGLSLTKG
jgi:hypothetical protein